MEIPALPISFTTTPPQNKIYTVIGATGSGKTPFITGGNYEEGLASIFKAKNMSTLVLDEIDHVAYAKKGFQVIHPDNYISLLGTKIGNYRTLCPFQHFNHLLKRIAYEQLVWNTLIVCEDSSKYIPHKFSNLEKTFVGNSKQQNCDIVFMYWNWGETSTTVLRMTKYFVIFPTADTPECREDFLKVCFKDCMEANRQVMARLKSKRGGLPYLIVDTGL